MTYLCTYKDAEDRGEKEKSHRGWHSIGSHRERAIEPSPLCLLYCSMYPLHAHAAGNSGATRASMLGIWKGWSSGHIPGTLMHRDLQGNATPTEMLVPTGSQQGRLLEYGAPKACQQEHSGDTGPTTMC